MILEVVERKQVFKDAIKKLSAKPFAACGADKQLVLIDSDERIEAESGINALAVENGEIFIGTQEGFVYHVEQRKELKTLFRHSANVCALDAKNNMVLSGSWDHKAILFDLAKKKVLQEIMHPGSVWCTKILNENKILTGCADGKLRIYAQKEGMFSLLKEISWHVSPIRAIISGSNIHTVDNYGRMHRLNASGVLQNTRPLNEMIFTLCEYQNGEKKYFIAGGEKGSVFLVSEDYIVLDKLNLDAASIWDVKTVGEKICCAGSNGVLYNLSTSDATRDAPPDSETEANKAKTEVDKPNTEVDKANTEVDKANTEVEKTNTEVEKGKTNSDDNVPKKKAEFFTSGGFNYKNVDNKIYISKNNEWVMIGDNVKQWDNSFPVELGDKKYTLGFNNDERVEDVAARFCSENKIDPFHHGEIVEFINKNFKKKTGYFSYSSVDLKGISQHLPSTSLIEKVIAGEFVSIIDGKWPNIYDIEKLLNEKNDVPLFVKFYISAFLISKKLNIDLSWVLKSEISNRKEGRTFVQLVTNLIENPPFSLDSLHRKIANVKDETSYINSDDLEHYNENMEIKERASTN
ncbi:phospholipase A-2-activating protein [Enteropsectra breve]|nr:phospholipase A-2-activating protein [Enteropsectra breve]